MFLHTSGGGLSINNRRLYEYIIFPLSGEPYNIFRFDQLVHMLGTFIATIVVFYLLRPLLKEIMYRQAALVLVIIMAGVGVGSINELIEFIVTVFIPDNGVGGYENTVIDMGANLIGAMLASIYILIKERNYVFHKQIGKDKNNQNLKNKKN
jgi:putative membrane protein